MSRGIKIQDLIVKKFGGFHLNKISCEWDLGEFILLTGDSGSGKSTLIHTVAGFNGVTFEGNILVDGLGIHKYSISEKAQKIGLMFQNPSQQFTMRTLEREFVFVLENCGVSYYNAKSRIQEAVDEMGISHLMYQELTTLSGGEKQRAALAILIAVDAPVFLLDEPFASIDPESRIFLINMLSKLRDKGKLIVVVDHDMTHYRQLIDRLFIMKNGSLTESQVESLPEITDVPKLKSYKEIDSAIFTLDNVAIGQGGEELIKKQDFTFYNGVSTLTGDNGAGKSTLMKAMVQLYPYSGKMFFQEKRVSRIFGKKRLYKLLTLAVQSAEQQFVTLEVSSELNFPKKISNEISKRQLQALEELNITHLLDRSLFHLSEGQKKMVQLISLLSLDHNFLILDEPFSGLDKKTCDYFVRWIEEKRTQTDFLIVSHRLDPLDEISDYHLHLSNKSLKEV